LAFNEENKLFYRKKDFFSNLPFLISWINETKNKSVTELSNDDCEIIAGLMYNLNGEKMLAQLNLSSSVSNYNSINNIIQNLPKKFCVQNITQVLFRIILLKPHIWQLSKHEKIVKEIKNLNKNFTTSQKNGII